MNINFIKQAINQKDINIILSKCTKGTGSSVNYFFYNSNYTPNKKGYVYFLIKNKKVVYIGVSTVRNRIGQHKKTKDFDYFYYIAFENYEHFKVETELIRNFKTKYNTCNVAKKHHDDTRNI